MPDRKTRKTRKNKKPTYSKDDYNSNDGMLTTVWGPGMWHYLHTMSFNYPVRPTCADKDNYRSFILNLRNTLPCGKCRKNLCKNLKIEPIHYRNKLFAKYAANLKEMMIFVNNKQIALLNILDNLFITDEGDIRINPKITEHNIQDIIDSTRNNILELYLKCEDDFTENIKLHEAIIESLIILTTEGQIINLNELLQKSSEKTESFDESTS